MHSDTFRASDLTDDHLGWHLDTDGAVGLLVAVRHLDDVLTEVVLDRAPWVASLPSGRPVEVTPRVDSPPV